MTSEPFARVRCLAVSWGPFDRDHMTTTEKSPLSAWQCRISDLPAKIVTFWGGGTVKWSLGTTTTLPEAVSKLIRFSALHEYVPESETFEDFNMKVASSTISLLVSKVDPSLSQLMLGLGWPVAAHVNLRSEPSSIAVDLGPWVIFTGTADQIEIVWVTNNVPVK